LKNESLIDTKSKLQSKSCESEISGKCIIHYKDLKTPYYHGSIPDECNRFMPYIHGLLGDNNLTDR
ncbi:hypothetical protein OAP56_04980, partial [Rickettsiaceae bacterium]|nr:hypothetical protein [Rickettsiaceae bacterium]